MVPQNHCYLFNFPCTKNVVNKFTDITHIKHQNVTVIETTESNYAKPNNGEQYEQFRGAMRFSRSKMVSSVNASFYYR